MTTNTTPTVLEIGTQAPDFTLTGTDGINHSLNTLLDGKKAVAVIFTCNHCPYVQAYEDRIMALQKEFVALGLTIICINSNNEESHPEDSFPEMIKRAETRKFNFPYLRDSTQSVAHSYGAQYTPEAFLFDHSGKLCYHGRIDDNWKSPEEVKEQTLRAAILAVIEGREITNPVTHAIGCSVKWKN